MRHSHSRRSIRRQHLEDKYYYYCPGRNANALQVTRTKGERRIWIRLFCVFFLHVNAYFPLKNVAKICKLYFLFNILDSKCLCSRTMLLNWINKIFCCSINWTLNYHLILQIFGRYLCSNAKVRPAHQRLRPVDHSFFVFDLQIQWLAPYHRLRGGQFRGFTVVRSETSVLKAWYQWMGVGVCWCELAGLMVRATAVTTAYDCLRYWPRHFPQVFGQLL